MNNQIIRLDTLQAHPANYNRHSDDQIRRIAKSLQTFGQVRSIVVRDETILAGHGVVLAARSLGWDTIRADIQDHLTEDQALAYVVADNELARQSDPDQAQLAAILEELQAREPLLVEAAGYSAAELEQLLRLVNPKQPVDAEPQIDRAEELRVKWNVHSGDLWQLGEHRLICGDCTDAMVVARVMGGERADMVLTDPPYGMKLDASYSNSVDNPKKGIKASRGYAPVIGDDHEFDPTCLFDLFPVEEMFLWGADYFAKHLPDGGSWLVWDKRASVEDLEYTSSEFELCWSKTPHHRLILRVPWFGIIGTEQQDVKRRLHPTQKPLGVIVPIIEKYAGDIVADPFLGSGTTLIACEQLGRRCYAIEVSPAYVAVALQRWHDLTHRQPERIGSAVLEAA